MTQRINQIHQPSFIFETSWEICNKVGGIYTVLSTRAATMVAEHKDRVLFVGPLLESVQESEMEVAPSTTKLGKWAKTASKRLNLKVVAGRWNIPGKPMVALVDFAPLYEKKDILYYEAWKQYHIDGTKGYGDYDESCLFAAAASMVMIDAYNHFLIQKDKVSSYAIFNEWMTGFGLLYMKTHLPEMKTLFITHATTVGRSISGNGKPLYGYLNKYNGDQMAMELNVEAKHIIEKKAAHLADGFGTVSEVTNRECEVLLEKPVDVILPNGFEPDFVPSLPTLRKRRKSTRELLSNIASKLYGTTIPADAFFISTSGRSEFRNKGLDLFIDVMGRLTHEKLERHIVAFILVPGWVYSSREDLHTALKKDAQHTAPMQYPFLTHWLNNMEHDPILVKLKQMENYWDGQVKIVYIPSYLNGEDGIVNTPYYDLLLSMDLTIYPSYYEPWGYTPLESIAFGVPTITTDLAGFGTWVQRLGNQESKLDMSGVYVAHRDDFNYDEARREIAEAVMKRYGEKSKNSYTPNTSALQISQHAYWECFYTYYKELYEKAGE